MLRSISGVSTEKGVQALAAAAAVGSSIEDDDDADDADEDEDEDDEDDGAAADDDDAMVCRAFKEVTRSCRVEMGQAASVEKEPKRRNVENKRGCSQRKVREESRMANA
jgi:hypothetical protein